MAIGRAYRIKKSELKGYGYTSPKKRSRKTGLRPNASVTHIAAINGRGSYAKSRSARSRMAGLSANSRRSAARSSLTAAKKRAFAQNMRSLKRNSSARKRFGSSSLSSKRLSANRAGYSVSKLRANGRKRAKRTNVPWSSSDKYRAGNGAWTRAADGTLIRRSLPKKRATKKSRRKSSTTTKARKKQPMARKVRRTRRKKGSARKRLKRNKGTRAGALKGWRKRRAKARKAPKRRKKAKAKTTVKRRKRKTKAKLKPNRRRRLRRNKGTSAGAKKGWRKRRAKARKAAPKRRRARKGKRKLSQSKSARAARRRYRAKKKGLKPNRRRRSARRSRALKSNRRRRSSRRRSYRSNKRRALSPNRRRRSSRRLSSNRKRRSGRRMRRNGRSRKMFRKNGVTDTLKFIAVTGGLALGGFTAHKLLTNGLAKLMNKFLGAPAAVVVTPSGSAIVTAPATSGLGALNVDPSYQKIGASAIVATLGILATAKFVKSPTARNTIMTGFALSFTHSLFQLAMTKFFPQYADMLNGSDGTAARLSAMYGLGASIQPRYTPIGEYFQGTSGTGMGEYFQGMGEYFQGTSGLGALPAYEAAAGMGSYSGNPDLMEAAAGMGSTMSQNTSHVDPHGDLDRELNIMEAAAGIGSLPSYEAAAGFGNISTVPSASTWVPGSANGQLWAGTRSISNPQSATEMVPAGILQTDGGQGVFG